jgi:hypothetical protein
MQLPKWVSLKILPLKERLQYEMQHGVLRSANYIVLLHRIEDVLLCSLVFVQETSMFASRSAF